MRLFHKVSFRKDPYNFKLSNIIKQNILQELFQQHIFCSFFVDKNNNLPLFIPYGKGVHETARKAQFGGPSECKGTPWRSLNIGDISNCQRGSFRCVEKPKYWGYIKVPEKLFQINREAKILGVHQKCQRGCIRALEKTKYWGTSKCQRGSIRTQE